MIISMILFLQINFKVKSSEKKKLIIILLYFIAIVESNVVKIFQIENFVLPWCIGILPLAITYISIGFFLREFTNRKSIVNIIVIIITLLLILLQSFNIINVKIDMKYEQYTNLIFVIVIPILFFIIVSNISKLIEKSKTISNILAYIGKSSMVIMYLHLLIKSYFIDFFGEHYLILLYVLATIIVCCLINYIFNKNIVTRKIFITGQIVRKGEE